MMKIVETVQVHDVTRVTRCTFTIEDVPAIPVTSHGVREFAPRVVAVRVQDGEVVHVRVNGPGVTKTGLGAERGRTFYQFERERAKLSWLDELVEAARQAYRVEYSADHCDGDVVAKYAVDGDWVSLDCQACAWRGSISPDAGHTRIQTRHEAVRA